MEDKKTDVQAVVPAELTPENAFTNEASFNLLQRVANTFAVSAIVPDTYKKKSPNDVQATANCIIAVDMAMRMKANPLMVMQNLYIVHGMPGWSSKFLIAALNKSGRFSPLRYEFKGDENTPEWSCRAYAIDKETGEELKGAWVSIQMANAEGWATKSGSKWKTMPELMLQYRAAAFFQRTYAPEISMGMMTAEEVEDIEANKRTVEEAQAIDVAEEEKNKAKDLFN